MSSRGKKKNPNKVQTPRPQILSAREKQAEEKHKKTANMHTVALIVFVVLTIALVCCPLINAEIDLAKLTSLDKSVIDTVIVGRSTTLTMNLPQFLGATASHDDAMEYIFDNVPALSYASEQYNITPESVSNMNAQMRALVKQITDVYTAVFALSILLVLCLLLLSVLIILKLLKFKNMPRLALSSGVYVTGGVLVVIFLVFFAVITAAGLGINFTVGIGMWLALAVFLAATIACAFETSERRAFNRRRI